VRWKHHECQEKSRATKKISVGEIHIINIKKNKESKQLKQTPLKGMTNTAEKNNQEQTK
jgi:hypothetical protein